MEKKICEDMHLLFVWHGNQGENRIHIAEVNDMDVFKVTAVNS
jgi:hypothetical protein